MKRRLAIAFAVLLVFAPLVDAMWVTQGIITNPTSQQILADTGAISGGQSNYTFIISCNAIVRVDLAARNAANSADTKAQTIFTQANGTIYLTNIPMDVDPGGRVVVRSQAAFTAIIQVSILKEGAA